ncbi:zinc finger phd-type [Holotrichia oblita]|uniref:Zinc finger phd-type n=1 Tax=Holotrichia oblita TaxID=644536 RepID=A0ACB9SMH0_HOLOL|nr:zinc finger phd-type [Holotrichia oblita]
MPHRYLRRTSRASWDEEQITLALNAITAGRSLRAASRAFSIPRSRSESPECRQRENYLVATPKKATNNQEVTQTSFADILQLPSCSKIGQNSNKVTKPRQKQHSDIFTSTPNKCALEEKESKKKAKLEKQKSQSIAKVCKRKVFEENKNEKRPETKRKCKANKNIYELSDDSDKYESEDEVNADICLICGEFGKDKELWLRCNICNQWAHAACAGKGRKELFVCDFCE